MKNKLKSVIFTFLSLSALACVDGQSIRNVAFSLGGGPVIHTVRYPQLKSPAYSFGGNLQLYFMKKGNFSFGLQAGVQHVVENFHVSYLRWDESYTQFPNSLNQTYTLSSDRFTIKNYLWQLFLNSSYQFRNNTFLEGSLGTILAFYENGLNYSLYNAPTIGLGGGYLFKITNTISIPLKLKTYYSFKPRIEDGGLKVYSGPLYTGIYSGIVFNVRDK